MRKLEQRNLFEDFRLAQLKYLQNTEDCSEIILCNGNAESRQNLRIVLRLNLIILLMLRAFIGHITAYYQVGRGFVCHISLAYC